MSIFSKITGRDARKESSKRAQDKMNAAHGGSVKDRWGNAPMQEDTRGRSYDDQAASDRSRFESTLAGGQDALNASTNAAMSAAMPNLFQALQGTRESNIRRGIYNGDTPTSYEGDVYSAFQRNIANATAGQSMNLFDTQASGQRHMLDLSSGQGERSRERYYDLISGSLDRKQAEKNARRKNDRENWAAAGKFGSDLIGALNPFKQGGG